MKKTIVTACLVFLAAGWVVPGGLAPPALAGPPAEGCALEDGRGCDMASDQDDVYVGRIRKDASHPNGLVFWIVGDNLRKGAALNAVQIAERLVPRN